jgi:hypothetical protein
MEAVLHNSSIRNPLNDLISDETYELLDSFGLFNETTVRDRLIRRKFKDLRERKMRVVEAIDRLQLEYPYLQYETIKKIVHHPPKVKSKQL